ncbi:MAG TPA: hypothetical protein VGC95_01950 [Chitinophagaceae bacterium]
MFDQILDMVKEHLGNNPQVSANIPPEQQEAVHQEVATHVTNAIQTQAAAAGGAGGLLSMLQGAINSNSPVVHAIEGGLVGSLGGKFGLSPMVTGAIAAALPGLLQRFAHKANDPNDNSITPDTINKSIPSAATAGAGGVFGNILNNL